VTSRDEIFCVVRRNILDVLTHLDAKDVTLDGRMSDLGANSLDRMDVVAGVLHSLRLEIAPRRLAGAHDIRSLVDVLFEQMTCLQ
jgi:polyketide biosynthesis acyl carrier protein